MVGWDLIFYFFGGFYFILYFLLVRGRGGMGRGRGMGVWEKDSVFGFLFIIFYIYFRGFVWEDLECILCSFSFWYCGFIFG